MTVEMTTDYGFPVVPADIGQETNDGILNIHKPDGWTSHDVVKRVRSILGIPKVGHAGTLDPHATGVLPILVGKGTRIAQHLIQWDKEYSAVLRLGQATDTQDAWGTVLKETSTDGLTPDLVCDALMEFQGVIQQVPPMFSAVKVGGQPLYKKARKGECVERTPKTVTIHKIEILKALLPVVSFTVACSKGTYIRTLCADIGEVLEVGGHLESLQRTRVGPLHIGEAINVESLEKVKTLQEVESAFWGLDQALLHFPIVEVQGDDVRKVLHGNAIPWVRVLEASVSGQNEHTEGVPVRVKDQRGRLLALGLGPVSVSGDRYLKIETVLL
ncbi:MAG: tRNA pseudouridine(55) synthase TruB [Nitrospirales bacterium]|nr:tRNA pseudouridine(55) synthase TruB [Nitrospirales bacterium]